MRNIFPQMNADKHRCFLAFAYGEANNKCFYLCLSAFICGKNAFQAMDTYGQT